MPTPLLSVRELRTYFKSADGVVKAVDRVSLDVNPGEVVSIVGESGSGKSALCMSIMRLIPDDIAHHLNGGIRGEVWFDGKDLLKATPRQMENLRGRRMAMIFQDPMTSLNPFLRVERQLTEVLERHKNLPHKEARRRSIAMLERVGIGDASRRIDQYPHQFSGGMRQRVMVAMALLCEPALLIADEPTTALDVTIQAQILGLIADLQRDFNTSILLVSHDLGMVAGMAHRILVMYAGRIVEQAPVDALYAMPRHPYTRGLLQCLPRLDGDRLSALIPIPGRPPDLSDLPPGCPYHPRCPQAQERCMHTYPPEVVFNAHQTAACWQPNGYPP